MAVSGIGAAATPQISPTSGQHKHHGHKGASISDVDNQSSSVASPAKSSGRPGSTLDVTA